MTLLNGSQRVSEIAPQLVIAPIKSEKSAARICHAPWALASNWRTTERDHTFALWWPFWILNMPHLGATNKRLNYFGIWWCTENKGISSGFRTFLVPRPRTRWLGTAKCTHFIGKNLNIDGGLNFPNMTSITISCLHLQREGYKKCKTSGLTLLSDTNAARFLYMHDWLFETFSSLRPPEGGSPALCSLRASLSFLPTPNDWWRILLCSSFSVHVFVPFTLFSYPLLH